MHYSWVSYMLFSLNTFTTTHILLLKVPCSFVNDEIYDAKDFFILCAKDVRVRDYFHAT